MRLLGVLGDDHHNVFLHTLVLQLALFTGWGDWEHIFGV